MHACYGCLVPLSRTALHRRPCIPTNPLQVIGTGGTGGNFATTSSFHYGSAFGMGMMSGPNALITSTEQLAAAAAAVSGTELMLDVGASAMQVGRYRTEVHACNIAHSVLLALWWCLSLAGGSLCFLQDGFCGWRR